MLSDLHCHLNGSFSLAFLRETALKNNIFQEFLDFQHNGIPNKETRQNPIHTLASVWEQFERVHRIVQTVEDIEHGTFDAIQDSSANYIEIRTTPKAYPGTDINDYIRAFVNGLKLANNKLPSKKAYGIISIDRSKHNLAMAKNLVDYIIKNPIIRDYIKAIDISGDPTSVRTLCGADLQAIVKYSLEKQLGIAIHIGETPTMQESQDIDALLSCLTEIKKKQPKNANYFDGRVRLGHAIFLNQTQRKTVYDLQIAIEICPSCHQQLNWHPKGEMHPVQNIYSKITHPVVLGSDDPIIFNTCLKKEYSKLLEIFEIEHLSHHDLHTHHQKYYFI